MTGEVRQALTREFLEPNTRPLIIGGDHAITYPIVLTYLDAFPDLGLLHLDAHNDLFYTSKVEYSHAAPISNLVRHTGIERVVSFGLRTFSDSRVNNVRSLYEKSNPGERLRLYSLISMKQLLMTGGALESELETLAGRPYYLTVDLDVLSESAIGRQLSTPFGAGIEWHELFYFLDIAFRKLNIIGCDLVEYDATQGAEGGHNRGMINSLLLLITDGLARSNPKRESAREPRA
jgi:agmatinase